MSSHNSSVEALASVQTENRPALKIHVVISGNGEMKKSAAPSVFTKQKPGGAET